MSFSPSSVFLPGFTVVSSILASALLPLALVAFSRGALRRRSGKSRILCAVVVAFTFWLTLLTVRNSLGVGGEIPAEDVLCGILVLATASIAVFSAWSLIVYGYTISMLVDLFDVGRRVSREQWMATYGGGVGLYAMYEDRLRLLWRLRLVRTDGALLSFTGPMAVSFARLVRVTKLILLGRRS